MPCNPTRLAAPLPSHVLPRLRGRLRHVVGIPLPSALLLCQRRRHPRHGRCHDLPIDVVPDHGRVPVHRPSRRRRRRQGGGLPAAGDAAWSPHRPRRCLRRRRLRRLHRRRHRRGPCRRRRGRGAGPSGAGAKGERRQRLGARCGLPRAAAAGGGARLAPPPAAAPWRSSTQPRPGAASAEGARQRTPPSAERPPPTEGDGGVPRARNVAATGARRTKW